MNDDPKEDVRKWIFLAYHARKKLGLRGITDLRRAVPVRVSRQAIYRVLTRAEIEELGR